MAVGKSPVCSREDGDAERFSGIGMIQADIRSFSSGSTMDSLWRLPRVPTRRSTSSPILTTISPVPTTVLGLLA